MSCAAGSGLVATPYERDGMSVPQNCLLSHALLIWRPAVAFGHATTDDGGGISDWPVPAGKTLGTRRVAC
jgi:hypothetical protein